MKGVPVMALGPGTLLRMGDAVVEITKRCAPCSRMEEIRPGLRAALSGRRGMYARVTSPGTVRPGDPAAVLSSPSPLPGSDVLAPRVRGGAGA